MNKQKDSIDKADSVKLPSSQRVGNVSSVTQATFTGDTGGGNKSRGESVTFNNFDFSIHTFFLYNYLELTLLNFLIN